MFSLHFGWLPVCFYELCKLLHLWVLVDCTCVVGVLWGPLASSSLVTCVCFPIVVEPELLFAYQWEGLTLRLIRCKELVDVCRSWPSGVGFILPGFWCLQNLFFECVICGGGWVVLCLLWSEDDSEVYCFWDLLGNARQGQLLSVHTLGLPGINYKSDLQMIVAFAGLGGTW